MNAMVRAFKRDRRSVGIKEDLLTPKVLANLSPGLALKPWDIV
jgi:hypothetical protein